VRVHVCAYDPKLEKYYICIKTVLGSYAPKVCASFPSSSVSLGGVGFDKDRVGVVTNMATLTFASLNRWIAEIARLILQHTRAKVYTIVHRIPVSSQVWVSVLENCI
jgi:hypothetical protein